MRFLSWLSTFLLFFIVSAAGADRYALVIGNDEYHALPPLQKAVNDAEAVGDALEKLGFSVSRGHNLNLRQIQDMVFDLTDTIKQGDTVFIFFAGHGVALGGGNFILPVDVPVPQGSQAENRVRSAAMSEADLIEQLKSAGAQLVIIVLDACRDNPFATAGSRSIGTARGLQPVRDQRGVFGIYSAGFGQTALDRLGENDPEPNSVFTRVLVPTLTEPGLSLVDIAYRVNAGVETLAKTVEHEQSPAYYDQARGMEIFLSGKPASDEKNRTNNYSTDPCFDAGAHWSEVKSSSDKGLIQDHLTRFGNCAFAFIAKSTLDKLEELDRTVPATECDRLAAFQKDPDRHPLVKGIPEGEIVEAAIKACQTAVAENPGERRLIYQLGRAYDSDKRFHEAAEAYRRAADLGSTLAAYRLGLFSSGMFGLDTDDEEAARWYRLAAEGGHAWSSYELGNRYLEGRGVEENASEALRWYRLAAERGHDGAMNALARIYAAGHSPIPMNEKEAIRWYSRSAEGGNTGAMIAIGDIYETSKMGLRDPEQVKEWNKRVAQSGDPGAMTALGKSYESGTGRFQNPSQAVVWFRLASEAGHPEGRFELGRNYMAGSGTQRNVTEGLRLLKEAAKLGSADAMLNLGLMYQQGMEDISPDPIEAIKWLTQADEQGSSLAACSLAKAQDQVSAQGVDNATSFRRAATSLEKCLRGNGIHEASLEEGATQYSWNISTLKHLQQRLMLTGDYEGPADGIVGPSTRAAFQRIYGQPFVDR
ncbi:caspase family protein [Shinella sp. G-2]|uniref:caspase family protein n=1 Tax=Shinella sp. G-2 TaxID=3133141 RepID=UPI003D06117B